MDIQHILDKHNLTKRAFAKLLGVGEDAVFKWLAGTHPISKKNKTLIEIWQSGGNMRGEFTRAEWLQYRRRYTLKELEKMTGINYSCLSDLGKVFAFDRKTQIILKHKLKGVQT